VTPAAPKAFVVASGMALEEGMLRLRGILAPSGQWAGGVATRSTSGQASGPARSPRRLGAAVRTCGMGRRRQPTPARANGHVHRRFPASRAVHGSQSARSPSLPGAWRLKVRYQDVDGPCLSRVQTRRPLSACCTAAANPQTRKLANPQTRWPRPGARRTRWAEAEAEAAAEQRVRPSAMAPTALPHLSSW
jgi:hypothetical protein